MLTITGKDAQELLRDAKHAFAQSTASMYEELRAGLTCDYGCKLYATTAEGPREWSPTTSDGIAFVVIHNRVYGCTIQESEPVRVERTNFIRYPYPNTLGLSAPTVLLIPEHQRETTDGPWQL